MGEQINIWEDAWIPKLASGKLTSQRPHVNSLVKVVDLIANDQTSWDLEAIRSYISQSEADAIFNIPLSPNLFHDEIIWKQDKKEIFFQLNQVMQQ